MRVTWVLCESVQFWFCSGSVKFSKEIQLSSKIYKINIKFENLCFVTDFAICMGFCMGFIFCLLHHCHLKLTMFDVLNFRLNSSQFYLLLMNAFVKH